MTAATLHVDLIERSAGNILEVHLSGTLNRDDYRSFLPRIEHSIRQHRKIRLLVVMHHFRGWTAGALREDLKFDMKHFTHVERLAIVGEKRWQAAMAVFCRPLTTAKVRYFDCRELAQARQWIEEPKATSGSESVLVIIPPGQAPQRIPAAVQSPDSASRLQLSS